jgi:hypothetical protein
MTMALKIAKKIAVTEPNVELVRLRGNRNIQGRVLENSDHH